MVKANTDMAAAAAGTVRAIVLFLP